MLLRLILLLAATVGQYLHDSWHLADALEWSPWLPLGPSALSRWWRSLLWVPFAEVTQPSGFLGHIGVELLAVGVLTWASAEAAAAWWRARRSKEVRVEA